MAPAAVVNLCIDATSPYSWFCLEVLLRYKERWGVKLFLRPMLVGAVMQAAGNSTPLIISAKGRWAAKDLVLNSKFMEVPFKGFPSSFGTPQFSSIVTQRVLTAVALEKGYESQELVNLFLSLYKGIWSVGPKQDLDVTNKAFVAQCCLNAGFSKGDTEKFLRMADESTVKESLKTGAARLCFGKKMGWSCSLH